MKDFTMPRPTIYPPANHTAQWFGDGQYAGSTMQLTAPILVLHTTEGSSWDSYGGGGKAPTLTYWPGHGWRQHFPLNQSSRALKNLAGGVQTNTAGAIQIELMGTCSKTGPGFYWPGAQKDDLRDLAEFIVWLRANGYPLPLKAPALWLPYPKSYGNSAARMTFAEWQAFSGVCGHQHVPENDHGDPGDFPIEALFALVRELEHTVPPVATPPAVPTHPTSPQQENTVALTDADAKKLWNEPIKVDVARLKWASDTHPAHDLLNAAVVYGHDARDLGAQNAKAITDLAAQVKALAAAVAAITPKQG